MNIPYSIGIVTYVKRFEKHFKPLIRSIKQQCPDIEIIVNINGEYQQPFDQQYLREILEFCSQYNNIFVSVWPEFRGLSKLWNDTLIRSSNKHVLLLNDDIIIHNGFFNILDHKLQEMAKFAPYYNDHPSFKINNSWSHIFINRAEIAGLGWFDERLLGVGEEDGDAELRYEHTYKRPLNNIEFSHIINLIESQDCLVGQRKVHGKYSQFNRDKIFEKYPRTTEEDPNKLTFSKYEWPFTIGLKNKEQYPYELNFWLQKHSL